MAGTLVHEVMKNSRVHCVPSASQCDHNVLGHPRDVIRTDSVLPPFVGLFVVVFFGIVSFVKYFIPFVFI